LPSRAALAILPSADDGPTCRSADASNGCPGQGRAQRARRPYLCASFWIKQTLDWRTWSLLLNLTGLWRSEALQRMPAHKRRNAVRVDHRSKSGPPRVVPLTPKAAKIARKSIPFKLQLGSFTHRSNAASAAAGMPEVRPHDFGRAFGAWLIERSVPRRSCAT